MSYLLIVEDDADVRDVVGSLLAEDGVEVEQTPSATGGLSIIDRRGAPALVLLDLLLGRENGTKLLDGMRDRGLLSQVGISLCSAVDRERILAVCKAYGLPPELCLYKPFEVDQLLSLVKRFMTPALRQSR